MASEGGVRKEEEEEPQEDEAKEDEDEKEDARWGRGDGVVRSRRVVAGGTDGVGCCCGGGSVRRGMAWLCSVWCVRLRGRDVNKGVLGEMGVECGGVRSAAGT